MKTSWRFKNRGLVLWQIAFLITSMSWLLAPSLNHALSARSTLISEYETSGQPYAWLFRLGDIISGLLVILAVTHLFRGRRQRFVRTVMLIVGIGLVIDPIAITQCVVTAGQCHEPVSISSVIHGVETLLTGGGFLLLAAYDTYKRRRWPSILNTALQVIYISIFFARLDDRLGISTLAQNIYQAALFVWLAWFVSDRLKPKTSWSVRRQAGLVRRLAAVWAFANGLLAILLSLSDLRLLGQIRPLYFGNHTAWLAQHGVIVGVALLYVSRHLLRGELRARQLLLLLIALQTLRYSLVSPNLPLTSLYALTFVALFVSAADFQRGSVVPTWRLRLRDLWFLLLGLGLVSVIGLLLLDRDDRLAIIASRSFDHFFDYINFNHYGSRHLQSVLLAHTITALVAAALATVLWILFRPVRPTAKQPPDYAELWPLTERYANSSEDYFKLWPTDKDYYYGRGGFIAYRLSGKVAYALADPVAPPKQRQKLANDFIEWTASHGLTACFLAVSAASLPLYGGLKTTQIGSTAIIDGQQFNDVTSRDKWWRWKQNRARKQGYSYHQANPPHSQRLLRELRQVSDQWLAGGRQEHGFALGYFDRDYLQDCQIHYLRDGQQRLVAFVNQLPTFIPMATIDLLRFMPDAQDAMPFLLAQTIASLQASGHPRFDLGFVPFAGTKGPLLQALQQISAGRFSAKGLEQFKNKFDPQWQPVYLAYNGDLGDLAMIALNLETVMRINN